MRVFVERAVPPGTAFQFCSTRIAARVTRATLLPRRCSAGEQGCEVRDRVLEALSQLHVRGPTEQRLRLSDVWLALCRIVNRQIVIADRAATVRHLDHEFGQLGNRELVWIPDVRRRCHVAVEQRQEPADLVIDVGETSGL